MRKGKFGTRFVAYFHHSGYLYPPYFPFFLPFLLQESFEHIQDWLNEVNRYASEGTCKLLVGNKSDRDDKVVSTERAKVRLSIISSAE